MADLPLVQALYDIPVDQLEALGIWEVVQDYLGSGFRPVKTEELEQCLAEQHALVDDAADIARGRSMDWKWVLGMIMATMRRALDDENLTAIELTHVINHVLIGRQSRIETLGYDRHAVQRARVIDICARLIMQVPPDDWLNHLLTRPNGKILEHPGTAARIQRRRRALGLTITELARRLDVTRTTVSRWEKGTTIPHPRQRDALAAVLGGEASDFA
jgi:DNA-binding XRE family transcriptional regulator